MILFYCCSVLICQALMLISYVLGDSSGSTFCKQIGVSFIPVVNLGFIAKEEIFQNRS